MLNDTNVFWLAVAVAAKLKIFICDGVSASELTKLFAAFAYVVVFGVIEPDRSSTRETFSPHPAVNGGFDLRFTNRRVVGFELLTVTCWLYGDDRTLTGRIPPVGDVRDRVPPRGRRLLPHPVVAVRNPRRHARTGRVRRRRRHTQILGEVKAAVVSNSNVAPWSPVAKVSALFGPVLRRPPLWAVIVPCRT